LDAANQFKEGALEMKEHQIEIERIKGSYEKEIEALKV